jgi:electron transfer flavoprotein alpha/beta subunit
MGIRKAARAVVPVWTLADLGMEAPRSVVSWPEVMNPPERKITNEIIEGDNLEDIAEKLVDRMMAEKVL